MSYHNITLLFLIPVLILAFYAQFKVKGNFKKFSKYNSSSGMTGEQIARRILDRNGLYNVRIVPIKGVLTDHYDPRNNTIGLSKDVFHGRSVSAASIAAHEVGHAIQHSTDYAPLSIRASMLPLANVGSFLAFPIFIAGMFLSHTMGYLMDIGIIIFSCVLVFHLFTLPVEFDASRRALAELTNGMITTQQEIDGSKKVLNAAALTYIAATLMTLIHLLRMILIRGSMRD